MTSLKDLLSTQPEISLLIGGLLIGAVFGAITLATNFCTMGALSDAAMFGDRRRLRAWLLAIAVAIAGTQWLAAASISDIGKSMYLASPLNWMGNLLGGLLMGVGMVLAGGCPSRNIARAGGGDLRALLVLIVIGITGYMTLGGVLGPARSAIEGVSSISLASLKAQTQGIGDVVAALTGLAMLSRPPLLGLLVASAITLYCFVDAAFRRSAPHVLAGLGVGLTVVAGWAVTGLAFDDMAARPLAPVSLTFVRPSGDTLEWLQRYTALGLPGFGVASLIGALLGAFAAALAKGTLHLATFADTSDTLRSLGGATLMGIGGVLAMGCTVGQGITGLSTLALGSLVTFAGIVFGGWRMLRVLERWA